MTRTDDPGFADDFTPLSALFDHARGAHQKPKKEPTSPVVGSRYLGKWRGIVLNNVDTKRQGRIQVTVPDVLGFSPSNWALPCVPITGHVMGTYAVPPLLSSVWVEFEQGDPTMPIWVGSFWDDATETPGRLSNAAAPGVPTVAVETLTSGVVVSDTPIVSGTASGTVTAYSTPATTIALAPTGVTTSAPRVETSGTVQVRISGGTVSISADTELSLSAPTVSVSASALFRVNGQKLTVSGP